jgi:peptide/nickel transport system permease protein
VLSFAVRRLLYALPILLGVSLVVFALMQLAPGDVADLLIPPEAPPEVAKQIRARLGLDLPVWERYLVWIRNLAQGDLGISAFTNQPVADELFSALGNTMLLALPASLLGFTLGVTLGTLAAFRQGALLDRLFSGLAIAGVSLPHYWVGIVLVAVFSVTLNALPAQGMGDDGLSLENLILPVVTLSLIPMGVIARLVRASVIETLGKEFVVTLYAKGLPGRRVLLHVLKNAAPSALALMGLQFGVLMGGSILVETVYNWPGSGGLMNLAIFRRDVPVLSGVIMVLAAIFVLVNIAVDLLQATLDPRIRR